MNIIFLLPIFLFNFFQNFKICISLIPITLNTDIARHSFDNTKTIYQDKRLHLKKNKSIIEYRLVIPFNYKDLTK